MAGVTAPAGMGDRARDSAGDGRADIWKASLAKTDMVYSCSVVDVVESWKICRHGLSRFLVEEN
jgi:hypothetical protein